MNGTDDKAPGHILNRLKWQNKSVTNGNRYCLLEYRNVYNNKRATTDKALGLFSRRFISQNK